MKPGAQDNATVQLATGSVSFPVRLFSLAGRNGLDFDLAIYYNGGSIHKIVDTPNLDAPTGLLGLGWSLPKEAIIRNTSATAGSGDDVYYLFAGGALYPLFKISLNEMIEGEAYECEKYNFWKIRYLRNRELWTVTKEDGDRYSYGGSLPASADGSETSTGNSIEWAVKWKNWVGPSDVVVGQEQFPIVWNLASIENIWGDRISFEYEQTQRLAGTLSSPLRRRFTKSCRLSRVTGASGDSIVLKYKDKQPHEYERPDNPPTTAHNNVGRIVGTLSADGWDPIMCSDPKLTLTITGKNGFTKTFTKDDKSTIDLSFSFDLGADAPDTLDVAFEAEDVDLAIFGSNDRMLSGRFTDLVANSGIVQSDSKRRDDGKFATLKLSYVKEQPATDDGDIYPHRQETHYLASIDLYSKEGVNIERAEPGYEFLGSDEMQKRVLTSITHSIRRKDGSYRPSSPSHLFEYYGEAQNDGVSVGAAATVDYKLFNATNGALYGALKSFTSPTGSRTSYRYSQLTIEQARRELEIRRPQNDSSSWQTPQTYFGPDYVVVIWKGSKDKSGRIYATVYQWHGRWVAADLGEITTAANGTLHVEAAADFFAIVTPGHAQAVHLFSPDKLRPGQWDTYAPGTYLNEQVASASGRNFLAVLDKQLGQLHRFTRDGDSWRVELNEPLGGGGHGSVLGMAARDNFIVTARAMANNSSLPELRLYHLDELAKWRVTSLQVTEHFFEHEGFEWEPKYVYHAGALHNREEKWKVTSFGTSRFELYAGATFVLVQAACGVSRLKTRFPEEREYFEVDRHFIYRWPEDYSSLKLDFQPCLDAKPAVPWDCIKRHNDEVVIKKDGGVVRPSIVGDQVIIDVYDAIATGETWTPKGKKFVYQYSGLGWYEGSFENDEVLNNYIGQNSFSTTWKGQAQYREYNPSSRTWLAQMPAYKDGNPSWFEKVIWPIIKLVGFIITLPLDFGPGLLVDLLFMSADLVIDSMTKLGGVAQGFDQFFSADFVGAGSSNDRQNNLVYHRVNTGRWESIGDLTPESHIGKQVGYLTEDGHATAPNPPKSGIPIPVSEDFKLDHRSTQMIENAVICALEREQYIWPHRTQNGFPEYRSRVQLFKNARFFKQPIELPSDERVRREPRDTNLSGANAFISFKGGNRFNDATALKLYRVINDDIQGPLSDFVVSQVTLNDGYSDTHTHYNYDTATAIMAPGGAGALYTKVMTTYSGASFFNDRSNGYALSLFHGDESALCKGLLYQTTIHDQRSTPVATNTSTWKVFKKVLTPGQTRPRTGYFVRSVATTETMDGATKRSETDYGADAQALGTPVEIRDSHFDAMGKLVRTVHCSTYGWQKYPALLAQNVLTAVVENRTQVNDIVTAASASTWAAATEAGGNPEAAPRWAPVATYQARRTTGYFDFARSANNADWQASSIIVARNAQYGVTTETQDVNGTVHSVLYDQLYRFPVATFANASIEHHQAGYYGFENYEQSELWQIAGILQQDAAHSGIVALTGSQARIEPRRFVPRSGQTPYIVSAWVKPRTGGNGGQIGFGSQLKTINAGKEAWQYVELITESPSENHKPFVSCDGSIDDFRFGPVDAPFSATVYDAERHQIIAALDSNGGVLRTFYDYLHRPLATMGPDGQILSLRSERLSRQGGQPFNPRQPNQTLTILPKKGGRYYRGFSDYATGANNHEVADSRASGGNQGLRFELVRLAQSNPTVRPSFVVRFGAALALTGALAWDASSSSGSLVLSWSEATPADQPPGIGDRDGGDGVTPRATVEYEPAVKISSDCAFLLLLIDGHIYCFIDGALTAQRGLASTSVTDLSLDWGPQGNGGLVDVITFYDPVVSSSFTDGLGRTIQTQQLADRGADAIAVQALYDGWGHAAVQTKPVPIGPGLSFRDDLVSAFDWSNGAIRGSVVDYFSRMENRVPDQQVHDHEHPYVREVAEASPLARIVASGGPGAEFIPGGQYDVRHTFGHTGYSKELLADLGLGTLVPQYLAQTTRRETGAGAQVSVQILDLEGNLIASRQNPGPLALTSLYSKQSIRDGIVADIILPKAFSLDDPAGRNRYVRGGVTNFLGLPAESSDCDRGRERYIHDRAGLLRFRLDAAGAAEHPNRILYSKYDQLGRVIEEGQLLSEWNDQQLQSHADTNPVWPESSTVDAGAHWAKRYSYDVSSNAGANVQERLSRAVSRDESGDEIEETYEYDMYGRLSAVRLYARAFDAVIRTTTYRYDTQGNIVEIGYPKSVTGTTPLSAVHYAYTNAGRVAAIGIADDPTFYAAYEYNVDGSVKTEWLNRRTIQRDYNYDFQGRLTGIVHRSVGQEPLFAETLSYHNDARRFLGGNITQVSFAGSAVPAPHRYSYQYDEHGRLLSAKAVALTSETSLPGSWDVEGGEGKPIRYDANGNIISIAHRGIAQQYQYESGTNRLRRTDQPRPAPVFSFERHELDRFKMGGSLSDFKENEWYYTSDQYDALIPFEKHSGTQSLQLGSNLRSFLRVSAGPSRYVFRAWVKNTAPENINPVRMYMLAAGRELVQKRIQPEAAEWRLYECELESKDLPADTVLEARLSSQAFRLDTQYPVYVDDVSFGKDPDYVYDASGRLTGSEDLGRLEYDPLTGLTREIRAEKQERDKKQTHIVKLRYGAQRQRVLKTAIVQDLFGTPDNGSTTETSATTLYLHGTNAYPLGEESRVSTRITTVAGPHRSGTGPHTTSTGHTAYVYGPGGVLAMCLPNPGRSYFFCKDHLGSVRVVLDQNGQVCANFDYLPFGELLGDERQSRQEFHYLYTGQEFDWETGLYNYRARMYDPILGRFCAPDPAHQYASPYEFVGNNPINLLDPSGTSALEFLAKVVKSDVVKSALWGAASGSIAGAFSSIQSVMKANSPADKAKEFFIAQAVGVLGGLIGGAIGSAIDIKMKRMFFAYAERTIGESNWSARQLRTFGILKGGLGGWVGGLASQITSNIVTVSRQQSVNWAGTLAVASVAGGFFGGLAGAIGATRMRTKKFAILDPAPGAAGYEVVRGNVPWVPSYLKSIESFGERWGAGIGAGLGVLGNIAPSEVS